MKRSKKSRKCPRCASKDVMLQDSFDDGVDLYVCLDCNYEFEFGGSGSKNRNNYYEDDDDFEKDEFEDDEYERDEEEWDN